jgi:hypothetical protein
MENKKCHTCHEYKPAYDFSKNKNRADGLQHDCKDCCKIQKNRWMANNENRTKHNSKCKDYRSKNKLEINEKNKVYRDSNIEKERERCRKYKLNNPVQRKLEASRAMARKHDAHHPEHNVSMEKTLIEMRLRLSKCTGIKHVIDYIIPLSKGGYLHHANIQVITQAHQKNKLTSLNYNNPHIIHWKDIPEFLTDKMKNRKDCIAEISNNKKCNTCGIIKSISEFNIHNRGRNKVQGHCRACSVIKNRQWMEDNKEYVKERNYSNYNKDIEHSRKRANEYRLKNLDKIKNRLKIYRKINPSLNCYHANKRRALKKNSTHLNHSRDMEMVFINQRIRLSKCLNIPFHVDHILPISRGGFHHHGNLQVVPANLNEIKKDKLSFTHPIFIHWRELPNFLLENIKLEGLQEPSQV